MRLKPSSYLILGMLSEGKETGYAIQRAVDRSARFFFAALLAQVYPELAALEEAGYVVSTEEPSHVFVTEVGAGMGTDEFRALLRSYE
jgi:DNA-binding PadR family transcriptional regulator